LAAAAHLRRDVPRLGAPRLGAGLSGARPGGLGAAACPVTARPSGARLGGPLYYRCGAGRPALGPLLGLLLRHGPESNRSTPAATCDVHLARGRPSVRVGVPVEVRDEPGRGGVDLAGSGRLLVGADPQ